jgi:hypothetical protein
MTPGVTSSGVPLQKSTFEKETPGMPRNVSRDMPAPDETRLHLNPVDNPKETQVKIPTDTTPRPAPSGNVIPTSATDPVPTPPTTQGGTPVPPVPAVPPPSTSALPVSNAPIANLSTPRNSTVSVAAGTTETSPSAAPPIAVTPPIIVSQPTTPTFHSVAAVPPQVESYDERVHICQPGDTFRSISQRYYRSESYTQALQAYNQAHWHASDRMKREGIIVAGEEVAVPGPDRLSSQHGNLIQATVTR